ncbi:flagellin-specific chaperone FliS [Keratinibaculum paraultunense]|uniref:Flagellin-specific chaperone FliS n=1 Tax=Keratinibaculum paraultunense TaxID=1278232 RepID=A0A4V2UU18_9FIRM|nr:flagellar protein FliS [Keratinibaculum paraultunense]QQY79841.1 flagellar protein FliS [Keratinibaculum paraultunense]TCS88723.1 flagellin-specific chaperone FliS [Keratinibaculum paraultunense]
MELNKRISTTNEAGLIAILYEALIDNFNNSIKAIDEGDYEKLNKIINHSRDILTELLIQFSGDDEISLNLREINLYVNRLITEGEYSKDPSLFKTCIKIFTPICEGFQQLEVIEDPKTITGLTYGKDYLNEHTVKGSKSFKG